MRAVITTDQGVNVDGGDTHSITGPTTITGSLVQVSGVMNFSNSPRFTVVTASAALSFSQGGFFVISGSSALTMTLGDPGAMPGGKFIFRAGSAHAHVLTGSLLGFASFAKSSGVTATGVSGSKLVLGGLQNDSVILESDGFHFLLMGSSGSATISQL